MAGALGLALAGPRHYAEGLVDDPWLGERHARGRRTPISRAALRLYYAACLLLSGVLIVAWLALHVRLPG